MIYGIKFIIYFLKFYCQILIMLNVILANSTLIVECYLKIFNFFLSNLP